MCCQRCANVSNLLAIISSKNPPFRYCLPLLLGPCVIKASVWYTRARSVLYAAAPPHMRPPDLLVSASTFNTVDLGVALGQRLGRAAAASQPGHTASAVWEACRLFRVPECRSINAPAHQCPRTFASSERSKAPAATQGIGAWRFVCPSFAFAP